MENKAEILLKKSLEFGAEKAKLIATSSISVGEWVRWKCVYGCPFYAQDGYHPPDTPDAESTSKVLGEYTKSILMNGPQGKSLTEAVLKLEGLAFRMGFYKAFALTALPVGGGPGWPTGEKEARSGPVKKTEVRPLMEACGIDVFKTARDNGFEIATDRETYGRWNYFALLLLE